MKLLLSSACCLISAALFAASPAATQQWVRDYHGTNASPSSVSEDWVRQYVATNSFGRYADYQISEATGKMTSTVTNEDGRVFVISHDMHDKLGLIVSNCTAAAISRGITNSTIFAYRGYGVFTNAEINACITSVGTNCLQFLGVNSHVTNGLDRIDGYFDVFGTRLDRPTANRLVATNAVSAAFVWPERGVFERICDVVTRILIPTAAADTWQGEDRWTYQPKFKENTQAFSYEVKDTKSEVYFTISTDENGDIDRNQLEKELNRIKLTSASIVADAVKNIVPEINGIEEVLQEMDTELKDLSAKLDNAFADIVGRLTELEEKTVKPQDDGSGIVDNEKRSITYEDHSIHIHDNKPKVDALLVDGKTIGVKSPNMPNAKYQLKNYPGDTRANVGLFPMIGYLSSPIGELMWQDPWSYFDDTTLKVDRHDDYNHLPSKDATNHKHGFHIKDFYSSNHCGENLITMLSDPENAHRAKHYILTRYNMANDDDNILHWLPLGSGVLGGGGSMPVGGTGASPTFENGDRIKFRCDSDDEGGGNAHVWVSRDETSDPGHTNIIIRIEATFR